jgi:gliding motility-associated-like protein
MLNGCPGIPDTFMIVTKPIPNVYSVPDISICAGVTVPTITFQGDMTSETDFIWSGNTNIGLYPNNGIDQIPTFVGVNTSQVIMIDSIIISPERQGCIGLEDTVLITVNPISTVTVNDVTVCNGVTVPPLPINGPSPTAIYAWTNNNTSIGLIAADTSFTAPHSLPSFTAVGGVVPQVAQIVLTPLVNGCPGVNDTMTITVNPTPIVNPVPSQSLCAETTSNPITFSGPVANTTYNWSHNNASIGLVPTSGDGNIPPFIGGPNLCPLPSNVASVTVTPVANGCSGIPINFSITVHPLPVINAGFDTTLCLGQFIIPQASGCSIAGNTFGFQWTATPTNSSNTTPLTGIPYYPDATTTLSVIGTDANLCQNVDTLIVTYLQVAPPQVFAGLDTALCFGESITLTAVHDADLLEWDNNINDGVEFTPDTTLSYIATASDINGCYSKDTIVVTVNPLPIITANASDDFICDDDSTILWGSGAGIGAVYSWDNNVIDSVGFVPPFTDTFTVIGTDINGCRDTASIDVTVNPNPVVLFSSNITFGGCLPFAPIFYDLSSPASASVTWDFGDGNTSNQLDSAINIYDNYGCYDVTLTSTTPEGCSTSLLQQDFVCVNPIIADFNPDEIEQPISDPEFEFNNTSQNATSFEWFFGDGGTSLAVHPDHVYDEIGFYSVILVASAQDGCTDTAVIVIKVRDEVIIYVPNSFTPDDNGLNDIFLPALTAGYDRTEGWQFKIYNRWGEEIFNSEIIGNGWDGTYKGVPAQSGSYLWTLRFKDSQNNKIHDFTGHINLIR